MLWQLSVDKLVTCLQINKRTSTFQVGRNSGGNVTNCAGIGSFDSDAVPYASMYGNIETISLVFKSHK